MAYRTAYTITEAREMLELWKDCEKALASGQAKAYKVGSREYTAFDLEEVHRMIGYFSDIIESLNGTTRTTRVARVIPRDL